MVLLPLTILSQCNNGVIVGTATYNGGSTAYIAQSGGNKGGVRVTGNAIMLNHGPRVYLANSCVDSFQPNMFIPFQLLDKTFSFTADLSNVGCGCNAALYLTSMPAYNQANQPDPTKCGDYYCDANVVCGVYCPEMDIFEANNRALQVTPHRCDAPQGKYYPHCDGGGCGRNTYRTNPNAFGPGGNFQVNTQKPFRVNMSFQTSGGNLNRIVTIISQAGGGSFTMTHDDSCGGGYLASMTNAFREGMVVVMSYWGTTGSGMSWLDIPPCSANDNCNTNTQVTFSDIMVTGNGTAQYYDTI